jgi:hypothetical protein
VVVGIVLGLMVAGVAPTAAGAVPVSVEATDGSGSPSAGEGSELSEAERDNLESLLAATSRSGTFDAAAAVAAGVPVGPVIEYSAGILAFRGTVAGLAETDHASAVSLARTIVEQAPASCVGRSGYTGWWPATGHQTALNSCQTAQLIAVAGTAIAGGSLYALVATLTAVGLPAGVTVAVATAIVALGLGFLTVPMGRST